MWVLLVVIDVLLKSDLRGVAVGWLVWVSWLVSDVLFRLELRVVAVGWQLWVSLMVKGMLFSSVLSGGCRRVTCVGHVGGD